MSKRQGASKVLGQGKGQEKRQARGPRDVLLNDQELFLRICSLDQLEIAWRRVWQNEGAAGGDRVTVQRFSSMVWSRLNQLHHDLLRGQYRPGPLRRVEIPKNSARGIRGLAIPCVVDRIVQTSVAQVLGPDLDAEFEDASFGYRPGRSVKQAVRTVHDAREAGFDWIVDADIENYFDRIPHDRLMERWGE